MMAKTYDGDYEYEFATHFKFEWASLRNSLKVRDYERIVDTFCDNLARIHAFHVVPLHLVGHMQLVAFAHVCALIHEGLDPEDIDQELPDKGFE